jgi:hypothetical protein
MPAFYQSIAVDRTWELVKAIDGYEESLGEQIVLKMMEFDANARKALGIISLRSERFGEISKFLVVIVDLVVSLMGPDIDEFEEEISNLGHQCEKEGIKVSLLGRAVSEAVKLVIGDVCFDDEDEKAWKSVIDFVTSKMSAPTE